MRPTRLAAFAAVGVALVAVVAWYSGGLEVGDPRFDLDLGLEIELPDPQEEDDGELEAGDEGASDSSALASVGFAVIGFAIACFVAWRLIKILRRLMEWVGDEAPRLIADESLDARVREALRDTSEQAARRIEDVPSGEAADAVIVCWMALEQTAGQQGTPRAAHMTPTEFTVELLHRHDADPRAVATLLRLYQKARFGSAPLPNSAAGMAAEALRTIAASLSSAASTATGDVT